MEQKKFTKEEIKSNRESYQKVLNNRLLIDKKISPSSTKTVDFDGVVHWGINGSLMTKSK